MTISFSNFQTKSSAAGLLTIAALVFSLHAQEVTVIIKPTDFTGTPTTQPVTLTNLSGPVFGAASNVYSVPSKTYWATNVWNGMSNVVAAKVHAGAWAALIGPYRIGFNAPNDGGTYLLSQLATNGSTVSGLSSFWFNTNTLRAGSNVTFRLLNGVSYVDAIGGTGGSGTNMVTSFGLLSTNVLWVSAFSGNDATAEKNNPGKPWMTVWSAMTSAVSGDTIRMTRGQYIETNSIGVNGVNIYLEPDAVLGSNYKIAGVDGPVLEAGEGVEFSVYGNGSILARSNAVKVAESGRINFDGATIDPPPVYVTNIFGRWVTQ